MPALRLWAPLALVAFGGAAASTGALEASEASGGRRGGRGAAPQLRGRLPEAPHSTAAWQAPALGSGVPGGGGGGGGGGGEEVEPHAGSHRAPVFEFYLYRAQNDVDYPIGNVNAGNLPGVMWYLTNEVAAYSTPCQPRYGITRIRRIRVKTRATPELFAKGMNFGVRYSYDAGKCSGSNIRFLGLCNRTWDTYGYVPGCNNFKDLYPYPITDTAYPNGIWYDLPLEGRCKSPTGTRQCTWSYEEAGEIQIADLESPEPGYEHCCKGQCTGFWSNPCNVARGAWRVQQAFDMFSSKYPGMPPDLPAPTCDFDRSRFWD